MTDEDNVNISKNRSDLVAGVRRCRDLIGESKYEDARALALDLLARAKAAGFAIGQPSWCLAVASDMLGDLVAAAEHAKAAVDADPLAPEFEHSLQVVVGRIKAALADERRAGRDPSTPKLYSILVSGGWADAAAHLAMARFHFEGGEAERALRLGEAVLLLNPTCVEAAEFVALVAEKLGDANAVVEARAQVAALRMGGAPAFRTTNVAVA